MSSSIWKKEEPHADSMSNSVRFSSALSRPTFRPDEDQNVAQYKTFWHAFSIDIDMKHTNSVFFSLEVFFIALHLCDVH